MLNQNKNVPREPEQQLLSVQSLYLVRKPLHALTAPSWKIVAEQLRTQCNDLLHQHNLDSDPNKHSMETANCHVMERIKGILDKGQATRAVFLDFQKDFNTGNHSIMLSKLNKFQWSKHAAQWFDLY